MERLHREKRLVGLKQSQKAIMAGIAKSAYIAEDAEFRIKEPFELLCKEHNVPVVYVRTMKELAKACRVEVPSAVAVTV